MFNILNKNLFDGKLPKIPIKYAFENEIVDKLNDHLEKSHMHDK